jgi:hypothetical protein
MHTARTRPEEAIHDSPIASRNRIPCVGEVIGMSSSLSLSIEKYPTCPKCRKDRGENCEMVPVSHGIGMRSLEWVCTNPDCGNRIAYVGE